MNKYNPTITKSRESLKNGIQSQCLQIAKEKNMECVPRELSLFILMEQNEKIIPKLKKFDVKAIAFYQELYLKYRDLEFKFESKHSEGEEWKENAGELSKIVNSEILPDVEFLTVFGKYLANIKTDEPNSQKALDKIYWKTFKETVCDAHRFDTDTDPLMSDIMKKYLFDRVEQVLCFYIEDTYDLADNTADITTVSESPEDKQTPASEIKDQLNP